MEAKKSWDEFIARQVQAQLGGEFTTVSAWSKIHPRMANNVGVTGPRGGMVWCWGFGLMPPEHGPWPASAHHSTYGVTERWIVNLTQQRVLDVVYE